MELERIDVFTDVGRTESSKICNITMTTTNCSNTFSHWTEQKEVLPEMIIVPCVFTIILVVGVIGNTLLILSFAQHKTLSTPHNALVVNLASGDFIFLIVSLPFNMVWYSLPNWPFGLVICKLSHFAEILATTVVICTLSVLSVERCLIVTGKKLWRQQKRGPIFLTLTIWSMSLLASMPSLISSKIDNIIINNESHTFCFHYNDSWGNIYSRIHVACMFIFLFCLPLLIISTAYILIAVHLLLKAFPLSQSNVKSQNTKERLHFRCCVEGNAPKQILSDESRQISTTMLIKNSGCRPKEDAVCKSGNEDILPLQEQLKSKSSDGDVERSSSYRNDDKSYSRFKNATPCSPDYCTESTELQQTPILPYTFVYTGPIPTEAISKHENNHRRLITNVSSTKDKINSCGSDTPVNTAEVKSALKETSPLNASSSGEAKPGYYQRQQSLVTKRRRLALTVLMLIIVFAVCWIPRHVYLIWYHFFPDSYDTFWHVFKIIGFCLSSSNSAVNPVVFYILDTTYRSFVHRSLCMLCIKVCRSKTDSSEEVLTLGERDYNATIALTDMKSKGNKTDV